MQFITSVAQTMKRIRWMAAMVMAIATAVAVAKLPPPTPEQAQAAAAKKEQEQANLEKQKILLDKAQDRVVAHYKRTKGAAAAGAGSGVTAQSRNIPLKAVEPAGTAGPQGGKEQSAEAHSTPAK
ncbi:MAG TPA: hypothetical protein VD867_08665 [Burkholderiales bacterium]|nr:hypothetical protein [Burkholderiales bacterium]